MLCVSFQDALGNASPRVRVRLDQLNVDVGQIILFGERDIVRLLLFTVCLLVGVADLLLFKARRDLDTLQEANAEPDILRASMILEREGEIALVLILPGYDGVPLALEVILARNEPAQENLRRGRSVFFLRQSFLFLVGAWRVVLLTVSSLVGHADLRDYLHVVFAAIPGQKDSEVPRSDVHPLGVRVQEVEACAILLRHQEGVHIAGRTSILERLFGEVLFHLVQLGKREKN